MVLIVDMGDTARRIDGCEAVPYAEKLLSGTNDVIVPCNDQPTLRRRLCYRRAMSKIIP